MPHHNPTGIHDLAFSHGVGWNWLGQTSQCYPWKSRSQFSGHRLVRCSCLRWEINTNQLHWRAVRAQTRPLTCRTSHLGSLGSPVIFADVSLHTSLLFAKQNRLSQKYIKSLASWLWLFFSWSLPPSDPYSRGFSTWTEKPIWANHQVQSPISLYKKAFGLDDHTYSFYIGKV